MTIIETQNLDFGFTKKALALKGINLKVEKGSIYGFLGPNGSGKTTSIRLLLGLLPHSKGEILLFEQELQSDRITIFSKIGALIEQPSLYEHLSGYDNLEITRRIRNIKKQQIEKVLELVDLTKESRKKVKAYSLGMKQRLGLAIALLSEPELLILDEPVNGLDPNGIIEIRELLLRLNREFEITIFLSSHLLSEIEKIVTHVGILSKGKLAFQGRYQALQELQQRQSTIQIETNDNQSASILLKNHYQIIPNGENAFQITFQNREQVAQIAKILVDEGLDMYRLQVVTNDLEKIFLEITSN